MVGIVVVSHSHRLAEGVAELAREMGGADVRIETAGGLAMPDHPTGTDAVLVLEAIERAWSDDGVLVLMDLGSAVLSAEMALDMLPEERRSKVLLCEAPFVEGAVSAVVTARLGSPLERVAEEARGGLAPKVAHLGTPTPSTDAPARAPVVEPAAGARSVRLTVSNAHGLHARPAARFVQTASAFDAQITVRNVTAGRGPVSARSLNAVATLGVAKGHDIEVVAAGPQAGEAIAAIEELAHQGFGDETRHAAGPPAPAAPLSEAEVPGALRGHPASPGVAVGAARRFHAPDLDVPEVDARDPEHELAALEAALEAARADVRRQRDAVAARAGAYQAAIFEAHLLFLQDADLLEPARRAIGEDGRTAARAWREVVERTAATWDGLEDEYLRARAEDLRSIGRQVLAHLLGVDLPRPRLEGPGILMATDVTPADAAGLDPATTLGIATELGGPTSHASVLARSFGIPAVVGVGEALADVPEGTTLALDGAAGLVHVDPSESVLAEIEAKRSAREETLREAWRTARAPASTSDGTAVEVAANIGGPGEVKAAVDAGADAVGLFRTEFLFMGRDSMPDEKEQEAAYRHAAEALDGRALTLRTLDVGADKPLPYLAQPAEENPFLGVRGLRLGLERLDLLETQLRAILRVAADHRVRVMFPMVATFDELRAGLSALGRARDALEGAGQRPGDLEVGIMVEVPAAALTAELLAAEVDFLSIGTNDLTQYALAADRGNDRVAHLADALHPAVLRLIARAVEGADAHGRWAGVCGEVAGDPAATAVLLGLGVRELSMGAPAIPVVKQAVRATELSRARSLAALALSQPTAADVRRLASER